ncbi:hypothetical protein [Tepidibacillus marianensis]|uniref:hypothetical protein n=1 Tax=Tepidibacillus marianensis TaxID=3131995 RepID=UPI0030D4E5FE
MTKEELQQTWFLNDIKTRVLEVAFNLSDDTNYNKESAIETLIEIADILHQSTTI